jgi:hypothetical protein
MDWEVEVRFPVKAKDFSSNLCILTGSEAHLASYTVGISDPFPGGKARPGRNADHSPSPGADDNSELELCLLYLQPTSWHAMGLLYLLALAAFQTSSFI